MDQILFGDEGSLRDIPGMKLWLDAKSINQADGTSVSAWLDQSGNQAHMNQATSSQQPIYKTNIVNGYPVVRFDGVDDNMSVTDSTKLGMLKNVDGATTVIVKKNTNYTNTANILFISNNTTGSRAVTQSYTSTVTFDSVGGRRLDADSYQALNTSNFANTSFNVITGVFDYANSDIYMYGNGQLLSSSTAFQTSGQTSNTDSASIGLSIGLATYFTGDIAEVCVWNRALSTNELNQVHTYLFNKYGFTPTNLSGCKLWLDASTLTGANASSVTTWADSSGNAYDFTQATSSLKPTLRTNLLNGKNGVRFDGVDDYMGNTTGLSIANNIAGITVFNVWKLTYGAVNYQTPFCISVGTSATTSRVAMGHTPTGKNHIGGRRLDADTFASNATTADATNYPVIQSGYLDYANAKARLYINGTGTTETTFQTVGNTSATNSLGFYIGSKASTEIDGCDMFETIVYNRKLTDAEIAVVHKYLSKKWGIPLA